MEINYEINAIQLNRIDEESVESTIGNEEGSKDKQSGATEESKDSSN